MKVLARRLIHEVDDRCVELLAGVGVCRVPAVPIDVRLCGKVNPRNFIPGGSITIGETRRLAGNDRRNVSARSSGTPRFFGAALNFGLLVAIYKIGTGRQAKFRPRPGRFINRAGAVLFWRHLGSLCLQRLAGRLLGWSFPCSSVLSLFAPTHLSISTPVVGKLRRRRWLRRSCTSLAANLIRI
jgi:hypothetical protein